uniref:hypothetical protein n=1 Tax=Gelidibacter sp. TaxID=2018083 RepID=UPI00404A250F
MSKIEINSKYLEQLSEIDASIEKLNKAKLKILLKAIGMRLSADDFEKLLVWDLITVSLPDKQMAVQLNKLSAYMPNLKFVVSPDANLFELKPGDKSRRVWKER